MAHLTCIRVSCTNVRSSPEPGVVYCAEHRDEGRRKRREAGQKLGRAIQRGEAQPWKATGVYR